MTAADYRLLSDIIFRMDQHLRNRTALHFADHLRQTNQRFDQTRFLQACGYKPEDDEE